MIAVISGTGTAVVSGVGAGVGGGIGIAEAAPAQDAGAAGQPGESGQGEQRPRGVAAVELVGAQEGGERPGYRRAAAAEALPGCPDRPQAHVLVGGVGGLELPARDGGAAWAGDPGQGEQPQRVPPDRGDDAGRILPEHALGEVGGDGRGTRSRRPEVPQRRLRAVHEVVDAELQGVLARRAQRPLVGRELHRMTVSGQHDPAVELVGSLVGQLEMAGDCIGRRAVGQDRQQEGGAEHRCLPEPAPPSPDRHEQVERRRQDEDLADLPDGGAGAERESAGRDHPGPGRTVPEQDDQPGHDERLEQDIGHDALLYLDLVGIEQNGRRGQGGQRAGSAPAQQQDVQGDGHPQAEQVLHRGDHVQVAHQQDWLQQDAVAQGVVAAGPLQVPDRVAEDQRGTVGGLRQDAQDQARRQQHRQQPMPPQQRAGAAAGPARDGQSPGGCRRHCHESHPASEEWAAVPGQ